MDNHFEQNPGHDDEAAMAKADLYKLGKYSIKMYKMLHDGQELEGWVQAKITKAADYIASVYHYMEYEMKQSEYGEQLETADMYSESVKRAFQQKLMEAKAAKATIDAEAKKPTKKSKVAATSESEEDEELDEAAKPSAGLTKKEKSAVVKKAKAGEDIGKKGKGFEKVEKAAKKSGAKDPKAVAGAALWKAQAAKKAGK
jgi:hypothetical protein